MDENIGYNGAYSGAEIDAAIGAVKNKETTWDGKQDKLTGVQGQVVGFDDEGDAVAMPAPDTGVTTFNGRTGAVTPQAGDYTAAMVGARGDDWTPTADDVGAIPAPEGGTAGQVLTKTADGEAWQDAPSGLPDGGTTGQILTQGANGPEWADAPDTGVTTFNNRSGAVMPQSGDYTADMVGARGSDWTPTADEVGAVPVSRTINGKALNANITLGAGDVGAVPTTTTVNGKALSGNISLTAGDVGAIANPSGGSDGQMLYKSADGAEWGDKPVMYVNITGDDSSGYAADKTASEIYEAYSNGNAIFAINESVIIGLYNIFASGGTYAANFLSTYGETVYTVSVTESAGNSYVNVSYPPISPDAVNVDFTPASTLTSDNVQDAIIEVQGNVDAAKPILRTATLTTSGWSGNSQTVTVNGVVANSSAQLIYVSPANKDSATAWGGAGVFCSAQGANSLTFVCDSTPSANITVNISIQEAQT